MFVIGGSISKDGLTILDCWMSEPNVRSNIGLAIKGRREKWIIQGHIGSTWENGQYVRTRDLTKVKPAFEDLLTRLQTDYIDLGMIHFIDTEFPADNPVEFLRRINKMDHPQIYVIRLQPRKRDPSIGVESFQEM